MNKNMMLAVLLAGGLITLAYASQTPSFQPIQIPGVGWSSTLNTSNAVKVHESSNTYICRITANSPDIINTGVIGGTSAVGYTPAPGICPSVVTENMAGGTVTSSVMLQGIPSFLTGKDFFKWQQFVGTTPAEAVSAGPVNSKPGYICRVNLGAEGYVAGLYDEGTRQCTVIFRGALQLSNSFDILIFQSKCKK